MPGRRCSRGDRFAGCMSMHHAGCTHADFGEIQCGHMRLACCCVSFELIAERSLKLVETQHSVVVRVGISKSCERRCVRVLPCWIHGASWLCVLNALWNRFGQTLYDAAVGEEVKSHLSMPARTRRPPKQRDLSDTITHVCGPNVKK